MKTYLLILNSLTSVIPKKQGYIVLLFAISRSVRLKQLCPPRQIKVIWTSHCGQH
jgi:hypothetical protein